jgi:hypothetical protein
MVHTTARSTARSAAPTAAHVQALASPTPQATPAARPSRSQVHGLFILGPVWAVGGWDFTQWVLLVPDGSATGAAARMCMALGMHTRVFGTSRSARAGPRIRGHLLRRKAHAHSPHWPHTSTYRSSYCTSPLPLSTTHHSLPFHPRPSLPSIPPGFYNWAGCVAWYLFLAMGATSFGPVRRTLYEAFRCTHWLFMPAIIFSSMHMANTYWYGEDVGMMMA